MKLKREIKAEIIVVLTIVTIFALFIYFLFTFLGKIDKAAKEVERIESLKVYIVKQIDGEKINTWEAKNFSFSNGFIKFHDKKPIS